MTNYRRKRRPIREVAKQHTINERIMASQVRVINEEGEMIGIMSSDEALQMAYDMDLDLVMINPKAEPAVTKIIDYNKFKYQLDKADENKKKKTDETKTLLASVRISDHDLLVRAKKADEFLTDGIKVKLQVKMQRREKAHPEVAAETIAKFLKMITYEYITENPPKLEGDSYISTIKPKK